MKKMIFSISLLVLFVLASYLWESNIYEKMEDIKNLAGIAIEAIEAKETENAQKIIAQLESLWTKSFLEWTSTINHTALDEVTKNIERAQIYLQRGDATHASVELAAIRQMLQVMMDANDYHLGNLF